MLLNGDGEQSRGFTYVDDIARGTILGLKPVGYEIINLGGHETIKINDLIHWMEELIGKQAQIEHLPAQPGRYAGQPGQRRESRAPAGLGAARVAATKGLASLVAWYNAERSWASQIET